jgi:hypothetical protein
MGKRGRLFSSRVGIALILITVTFGSGSSSIGATDKCGVVCDETWSVADSPFLVTCPVILDPVCSLTIDAGVEVDFQVGTDLTINGTLDVNGTTGSAVTFTSAAISPQAGDWGGLRMESNSNSTIDNAQITYAVDGVTVRDTATTTLIGVSLQFNEDGMNVEGTIIGPATVNASGCTITNNTVYGVHVSRVSSSVGIPNPSITVTGSSIHSNAGTHDFYTGNVTWADADTTILWVSDCGWGTTDQDEIRDRIYDREDRVGRPRVYFRPFGQTCQVVLGGDQDGDSIGDFEDNCPDVSNTDQIDLDGDRMGDACDPAPASTPGADCNGIDDVTDGFVDSDGDGWGDPCDFQPTRSDSYPGAPEICDGYDNDGNALFAAGELTDEDLDENIGCAEADCDDFEPEVNVCACEDCSNLRDDDCDGFSDGPDPDCWEHSNCVILATGSMEPELTMEKGVCGAATLSGPFDVIRGDLGQVQIVGSSVDLGRVACMSESLGWNRVTDLSADPNPACDPTPVSFYLAKETPAADYGAATTGERRDQMEIIEVCPCCG